jgi:hypothetical protein
MLYTAFHIGALYFYDLNVYLEQKFMDSIFKKAALSCFWYGGHHVMQAILRQDNLEFTSNQYRETLSQKN